LSSALQAWPSARRALHTALSQKAEVQSWSRLQLAPLAAGPQVPSLHRPVLHSAGRVHGAPSGCGFWQLPR
jgi:hypothetical protein